MHEHLKVPVEKLRYGCDETQFAFVSTEEVEPLEGIIGQRRAEEALSLGLRVNDPGYNIYVAGPHGTGKTTFVRSKVTAWAKNQPPPGDWCYVYNFVNPAEPQMLFLPPGWGKQLAADMEELVRDLQTEIPHVFNSEEFKKQQQLLLNEFQRENSEMALELERLAREAGLALMQTPNGFSAIPVKEGKPLSQAEIANLSPEERQQLQERTQELQWRLMETLSQVKARSKVYRQRLEALKMEAASYAVEPHFHRLFMKYQALDEVVDYLTAVMQDILAHLDAFRDREELGQTEGNGQDPFLKYQVNVLVDNCETCGAPVVVETNPNYYNLFGMIEYHDVKGLAVTDFMKIKPGALHRANGGYLILQAQDLLSHPLCWQALKRAIKNQEIRMENLGDWVKGIPVGSLRPEPIALSVKVILIGSLEIYHLLYHYGEDFAKYFKILADFDSDMPRTDEHVQLYASFISSCVGRKKLKHFAPSAVARVVEYGARLAGSQEKLSTRLNEVAEIIQEASAWAEREGAPLVQGEHVWQAVRAKRYRGSRLESRLQEMMIKGKLLVRTEGSAVGQVNGLAVYQVGYHAFGRPTVITARVFAGTDGIVNIEREAELSGRIHDKGVLILSGYLGGQYARHRSLALSASICFEQSYDGVDGDSASSAELYALLSALAEVPLKQSLAVTGSINQKGEIQPVGGINEKIEGFFELCRARGLTGEQGVIIPRQNVSDLMLSPEVVEAVAEKKFHIYAISHVDQGIELLTNLAAGEMRPDGTFTPGSFHALVDRQLAKWARLAERTGGAGRIAGTKS